MNPFEIFNLPPTFSLNLEDLNKAYLSFQSLYHPDRHVHSLPHEKDLAHKKSTQLNQAYGILKNPVSRARAILESLNIPVPGEGGATIQSPELLMEMMDLREKLEACEKAEDYTLFMKNLGIAYQKACDDFEKKSDGPEYLRLAYLEKLQIEAKAHLHADSAH